MRAGGCSSAAVIVQLFLTTAYALRDIPGGDETISLSDWRRDEVVRDLLLGEDRPDDVVAAKASDSELLASEKAAEAAPELQPVYEERDIKAIAIANMTPIASAFNGSYSKIKKAGKTEEMAAEYHKAAQDLAIQKDLDRIEGNNATKRFSKRWNSHLKDQEDKIYRLRTKLHNESRIAYKERWNEQAAALRMIHAEICKNLTTNNPYPINSSQYKAAKDACKDESPNNLNNQTAMPKGSHDDTYGPHGSNSSKVDPNEAVEVSAKLDQTAATAPASSEA